MSLRKFNLIVAVNRENLIGIKEYGVYNLPWPMIRGDMNQFQKLTTECDPGINAIIMGYHTWNSLSETYKKNSKRQNIVISRDSEINTFGQALEFASALPIVNQIWVIGGAAVYHAALGHAMLDRIYLTEINHVYPFQNMIEEKIYFPLALETMEQMIDQDIFKLIEVSDEKKDLNRNIYYRFKVYEVNSSFSKIYVGNTFKISNLKIEETVTAEYQYLDLIKHIMNNGNWKITRNGMVKSIFGYQLKYDLSKGYPLCTVKKSYPKSIFEELMWMIRGQTDVKILKEKNVHIWDKNSSKEYLESYHLPYEEGDIGPGYGFQMRYYGANYVNCHTKYQGFDQLAECIRLIRNDPRSRRIIINLWNPKDVSQQALPPCHLIYHFSVDNENFIRGKLNCHLFQRSWDVLLGWNTSTAALFTYILANHCDLDPGILVHSISDAHLYQTHVDAGLINQLLERRPRPMPILNFLSKHQQIEDYGYEDLILENYYPCPALSAEMVA